MFHFRAVKNPLSREYDVVCPACGHNFQFQALKGEYRGERRCPGCDVTIEWYEDGDFSEEWAYSDKDALMSILRGLSDAARGRTSKIGLDAL